MSDYPMLISNKLHSFRNFSMRKYIYYVISLTAASFLFGKDDGIDKGLLQYYRV